MKESLTPFKDFRTGRPTPSEPTVLSEHDLLERIRTHLWQADHAVTSINETLCGKFSAMAKELDDSRLALVAANESHAASYHECYTAYDNLHGLHLELVGKWHSLAATNKSLQQDLMASQNKNMGLEQLLERMAKALNMADIEGDHAVGETTQHLNASITEPKQDEGMEEDSQSLSNASVHTATAGQELQTQDMMEVAGSLSGKHQRLDLTGSDSSGNQPSRGRQRKAKEWAHTGKTWKLRVLKPRA